VTRLCRQGSVWWSPRAMGRGGEMEPYSERT